MKLHKMTSELALRPQYAQYPNPNPKPELFGQTRPEPDPKSKSPTRQSLLLGTPVKHQNSSLPREVHIGAPERQEKSTLSHGRNKTQIQAERLLELYPGPMIPTAPPCPPYAGFCLVVTICQKPPQIVETCLSRMSFYGYGSKKGDVKKC